MDLFSNDKTDNCNNGEEDVFCSDLLVENIHKSSKNKKLLWLYETENPNVHFNNGAKADDKYMQAIMLCYSSMTAFEISESANLLAKELKENELNEFAFQIFSKWISDGAETKKKWILYFSAIYGGDSIVDIFVEYIKEWSKKSRGAIAAEAVKALALSRNFKALMAVDSMAYEFNHKQVKSAAVQAIDNIAKELGITIDELSDKLVPDLGFDENIERIFDYGTRKFRVHLTPSFDLEIYDENDKKLEGFPVPSKKDSEKIAEQSYLEFEKMEEQLKDVISIQRLRLATALFTDRRWSKEAWNNLFVKNPIMHSFAIELIWAVYENDKLVQTTRYMEDGSFNNYYDENKYELPDNCTIGLINPPNLNETPFISKNLKHYCYLVI